MSFLHKKMRAVLPSFFVEVFSESINSEFFGFLGHSVVEAAVWLVD